MIFPVVDAHIDAMRVDEEEAASLVVVDEAYIEYGGETALGLVGTHPNVVILRTLSKAFALAGEVRAGTARPDRVLWFLAYDVVAWHLLTTDHEFFTGLGPSTTHSDRHEAAP